MIYRDRYEVERIGKAGALALTEDDQIYGRQLSSFWLAVDHDDLGYAPHALQDGYWESWITAWMSQQIRPGMHCIDVGANHGYYSFMMQQAGAQCMAIEPQQKLCSLMSKSVKKNKHQKNYVEIVNAAVSDYSGEVIQLNVPTGHGMNASISDYYTPIAPEGRVYQEVTTITLDDAVTAMSPIEFIKIDVEGAEEEVWIGMHKLWKRRRPTTLLEFRWDRYEQPEVFANTLFTDANVTHVDFDGREKPVYGVEHLASKLDSDWMLVLR